jgi:C-terminal processing protease CtpA/Prc
MMKSLKTSFGLCMLLVPALLFLSCEKAVFSKKTENNARNNFNYLWQEVNAKYSFFDIKNVNWQEVYDRYSPFVNNDMPDDSLFLVMANMLNELRDGHVNLISPFNISRYEFPLQGPENISFRVIKENYIGTDYITTGPFVHDFLRNQEIAYVRYASFANSFTDEQLDYMLSRYQYTKGMIFDIRGNGGGNASNVLKIINRFAKEPELLYSTQLKTGPGSNDFEDLASVKSSPSAKVTYLKAVYVLTDRGTFSAASFFSLCAQSMRSMVLVGDTTGGGLGIPNGGQLPNGWTYRFSVSRTLSPKNENYENGVPPDYYRVVNSSVLAGGTDEVLEFAMSRI